MPNLDAVHSTHCPPAIFAAKLPAFPSFLPDSFVMSDQPLLFQLESCDTVLNEARRLFAAGRFPIFASVLAATQTEGRGQHGHRWTSPKGNLYAGLRLPLTAPFIDFRGPMAVSAVIVEALEAAGFEVKIKWPNDIVLNVPTKGWAKCAGLLLEKKGELLTAGIGLNLTALPPEGDLREGAALPAGALREVSNTIPSACALWKQLAERFAALDAERFLKSWPDVIEERLLWRGERVVLTIPGKAPVAGRLLGVGPAGELRLATPSGEARFTEGSLKPEA